MNDRRKKTALVTGASSGMGKEIAKRLIKDGLQVFVAARHTEKMNDLVKLGAKAVIEAANGVHSQIVGVTAPSMNNAARSVC